MKKVLIFSLAYFPRASGAEIAIKEITDRMPEVEWHMVTKRWGSEPAVEKIGQVVVNRVGLGGEGIISKFLFQFAAARKGAALYGRHEYDAVWAMMAHSAGVPAALFKMRHKNVPYLLTLQEGDPVRHIERVMRPVWPLFTRAFTLADRVQAISNYLGEWARARAFAGPLEVVPNGVDTQKFKGGRVAHEGLVLITTSRLVRKNAVDDIIWALKDIPEAKLKVLGAGPEEQNLRELADELGLASRIEFLGFVPQEKIPVHLHAADIFIRPSRSEGMGNSFIEAMAAGLPVVATQEGGIKDFLFDAARDPQKEPTGFAVDKDSPEQIARAVKYIVEHPEEAQKIVAHAQAMVEEKYDWETVAAAMRERVFNPLLKLG